MFADMTWTWPMVWNSDHERTHKNLHEKIANSNYMIWPDFSDLVRSQFAAWGHPLFVGKWEQVNAAGADAIIIALAVCNPCRHTIGTTAWERKLDYESETFPWQVGYGGLLIESNPYSPKLSPSHALRSGVTRSGHEQPPKQFHCVCPGTLKENHSDSKDYQRTIMNHLFYNLYNGRSVFMNPLYVKVNHRLCVAKQLVGCWYGSNII